MQCIIVQLTAMMADSATREQDFAVASGYPAWIPAPVTRSIAQVSLRLRRATVLAIARNESHFAGTGRVWTA
jgi:hypothetical protein